MLPYWNQQVYSTVWCLSPVMWVDENHSSLSQILVFPPPPPPNALTNGEGLEGRIHVGLIQPLWVWCGVYLLFSTLHMHHHIHASIYDIYYGNCKLNVNTTMQRHIYMYMYALSPIKGRSLLMWKLGCMDGPRAATYMYMYMTNYS